MSTLRSLPRPSVRVLRIAAAACFPLACLLFAGCGSGPNVAPAGGGAGAGGSSATSGTAALEIVASSQALPLGSTAVLTADLMHADGAREGLAGVTWSVSDKSIIELQPSQADLELLARGRGTATVTAHAKGLSAHVTLTVGPAALVALDVPGLATSVPTQVATPLTAVGVYSDHSRRDLTSKVQWSSDNSKTKVDGGRVVGQAPGVVHVTATDGSVSASTTVTVVSTTLTSLAFAPAQVPVPAGIGAPLRVYGMFADGISRELTGNPALTWTSSDKTLATVDTRGVLHAIAAGNPTIKASFALDPTSTPVDASQAVPISSAVLGGLEIDGDSILVGHTEPFVLTGIYSDGSRWDLTSDPDVNWGLSDETLVKSSFVERQPGSHALFGVATGNLTLSAELNGVAGQKQVAVKDNKLVGIDVLGRNGSKDLGEIAQGDAVPLSAQGRFADGSQRDITNDVSWHSSDAAVASVSPGGSAAGTAAGNATITASDGLVQSSVLVPMQVVGAPASLEIHAQAQAPYYAGGHVSLVADEVTADGKVVPIPQSSLKWTSDSAAADVAADGTVRLLKPGAVNVTVRRTLPDGSVIKGSLPLTVVADPVTSITVDPPDPAKIALATGLVPIDVDSYGSKVLNQCTGMTATLPASSAEVPVQYFRVFAHHASGRVEDVTRTATASITYRDCVYNSDANEGCVGTVPVDVASVSPGVVTTGTEAAYQYPYPALLPRHKAGEGVYYVRGFKAPPQSSLAYGVVFHYANQDSPVARMLLSSPIQQGCTVTFVDTVPQTSSATPAVQYSTGLGNLLIKDDDPTYSDALRKVEYDAETLDWSGVSVDEVTHNLALDPVKASPKSLQKILGDVNVRNHAGVVYVFAALLTKAEADPSSLTPDETLALEWLAERVRDHDALLPQAELDEYEKWAKNPWAYVSPPGCAKYQLFAPPDSMIWLFMQPSPPDIQGCGAAIAAARMIGQASAGTLYLGTMIGYGALTTLTATPLEGGTAVVLNGSAVSIARALMPFAERWAGDSAVKAAIRDKLNKYLETVDKQAEADNKTPADEVGNPSAAEEQAAVEDLAMEEENNAVVDQPASGDLLGDVELADGTDAAITTAEEAGATAATEIAVPAVEAGAEVTIDVTLAAASSMTGPLVVVIMAATAGVQEGITVFHDAAVEPTLKANLAAAQAKVPMTPKALADYWMTPDGSAKILTVLNNAMAPVSNP